MGEPEKMGNALDRLKSKLNLKGTASTTPKKVKCRGTYEVTESVLLDNIVQVCESEEKALLCSGCKGLQECKQDTKGMFPTVEAYLGNLSYGFSFCRFEWTERQRKKMDRLFRFSRVPPNYAGKSFGDYKVIEHNERAIKTTSSEYSSSLALIAFFLASVSLATFRSSLQ